MPNKKPSWGAIFDFDGVIVNTERHHEVCWQQVASELKQSMTHEQYVSGFGVKNDRFIAEILGWTQDREKIAEISQRKESIFQEHAMRNSIELVKGVDSLLAKLHEHGVSCVIASSSILKNIQIIFSHLAVGKFFSSIVSGEDVKQGKPNPECFLCAASRLHLPPERCVVFEDALLGVEGAKRAGSKVVAITTTFPRSEFEKQLLPADKIIERFSEVSVSELDSFFENQ